VETTNAKITLSNVVSESEFIKGKVKVVNYTDKALLIKPEECSYSTPTGDVFSKDKWMVIAPRQQESKTIDVKGDNVKTRETTLKINGLYICNTVEIITKTDMPLPPEKYLAIGGFKLELDEWEHNGKKIMIKYRVLYLGDKIGLFDAGKVLLKSPDSSEFKNQKDKDKVMAFGKGEGHLIGFVYFCDSKKDNILEWKNAFSEGTPEKLEAVNVSVKVDLPKTKEKN
ncbi:MAG TPA: hypothetical protein VN026_01865, partial [Bacteroidia bacterium]|nr:hypothetical protein [Bacteroidia bacterium]